MRLVSTKNWRCPDGTVYRGEWSHPSVLLMMGVLPPKLYRRVQRPMTGDDWRTLYSFRGTGQFVGADARMKTRVGKDEDFDTLMTLRARGLLEHFSAGQWYLTDAGRGALRKLPSEVSHKCD